MIDNLFISVGPAINRSAQGSKLFRSELVSPSWNFGKSSAMLFCLICYNILVIIGATNEQRFFFKLLNSVIQILNPKLNNKLHRINIVELIE